MTPIADLIGPLAEGVILLGVLPAAVLLIGMIAISRVVEWRTSVDAVRSWDDVRNTE